MATFRLLHTADWQLGKSFGRFDQDVRSALTEARFDAIDNLGELSVDTRLAFADVLLEQGRPVSLILDDPLVYSDDGRLDLMTEILSEAAERMQVILLTCRERAFRHVEGKALARSLTPIHTCPSSSRNIIGASRSQLAARKITTGR